MGSALMAAGVEWIVEHPWIRRIELEVHAQNEAAIRLDEHWGFVHEGKQIGRLYQHGQYVDTLRMARLMMEA
jgi:RimJ/RimL family protein N-acetyltransferase